MRISMPCSSGNNEGAIWGSGNGPAVDASGNIYVETGNGNFDGTKNFSDSVIKVSPAGARLNAACVAEGLRALKDCPLKDMLLPESR